METGWIIFWSVAGGGLAYYALPRLAMMIFAKRDPGGDGESALVIFSESLRWLGYPWGMASCAAGLRRAGFDGEFLYWRWHATWRGWLVLPAIADGKMLQREAKRLADFIAQKRRENPRRAVYLIGYSCGGFVAARALELLPQGVTVDSAALLAPAIRPGYDLRGACEHVSGSLVVESSILDAGILGLGTLISGTGDRRHTPSMGMLGYRGPHCPKVTAIRWRPRMIRCGHCGGHFSAAAEGFVATHIAGPMGIGRGTSPRR